MLLPTSLLPVFQRCCPTQPATTLAFPQPLSRSIFPKLFFWPIGLRSSGLLMDLISRAWCLFLPVGPHNNPCSTPYVWEPLVLSRRQWSGKLPLGTQGTGWLIEDRPSVPACLHLLLFPQRASSQTNSLFVWNIFEVGKGPLELC